MLYSIPLKIDIVFKHVFTNDLNGLASLISCILFPKRENKVIEITILSSEIIPIFKDGKRTFLDLKTLAKLEMNTSDDPYVQIELQVYEQSGYVQRSLFYATGLIQNQLRVGDSYFQLSPVIQINLLDFELLPTENIVSRYLLKEEDSNHVLTQLFQMVYVELTKFKIRNISDLNSEREIWFYLLNNMQNLTEENRMEILAKKPDLKYAFDALDLYASDPDKRREFEERIRADKNYAYELAAKYEKGMEKGKIEKAIETAQKLLERGFSKEEALEITGLTPEDLERHGF